MRYFRVFLAMILLTLPFTVLNAIIAPELSIKELTVRSDVIILGSVIDVESRVTPDGKSISTYAHVKIIDRYKGELLDNFIVVETAGGTVGVRTVFLSGSTSLIKGEKFVLFLKLRNKESNQYRIVGLYQGKFRVIEGGLDSEPTLQRDISAIDYNHIAIVNQPKTLRELIALVKSIVNSAENK